MAGNSEKSTGMSTGKLNKDVPRTLDITSWKPGGEADKAKNLKDSGDFGVPVGSGSSRDREYVNENTKRADPGAAQRRSGEDGGEGTRTSGAGGDDTGVGSSSGGDLDTTFIGVGTGGSGIAQAGPDDAPLAADETDGSTDDYNSPVPQGQAGVVEVIPASGRNQTGVHQHGGSTQVAGSFRQGADVHSGGDDAQGADAATNPAARGDDSFAGEISSGEASGQDNSPSDYRE